jgi:hypothetical protein
MIMPPLKNPAPAHYKVGRLRQWVGLLGAPCAWIAQMNLSEMLTSHACYPHDVPLQAPLWDWLHTALAGISIACFAVGIFTTGIAWNSYRRSKHEKAGGGAHAVETGEGRTRFLALMGIIASGIFLTGIVFTGVTLLLVSSCQSY